MRDDPRRRDRAAYPFSVTLEMRFGDMDVWRHLNNVAAMRFYEDGRIRFFDRIRSENPVYAAEGARVMVVHAAVDYLAEGHYPHPIEVCVAILGIGNSSYRVGQALFQQGRCIGLADIVLAHVGETGAAPLSDVMRATLSSYQLKADR